MDRRLQSSFNSRKPQKKNSIGKRIFQLFGFLVVAIIIAGLVGLNWYNTNTKLNLNESTIITVNDGESFTNVVSRLESEGIVKSKLAVQIYMKLNNLTADIKAGDFVIAPNLSIDELIVALEQPPLKKGIFVTLKEGLRYEQMAKELSTNLAGFTEFSISDFEAISENPDSYTFSSEVQNFLDKYKPQGEPLRGFLFPDTYRFDEGTTELEIIDIMIKNFIDKVGAEVDFDSDYLNSGHFDSFYEALTLASIIEKEASSKDKKSDISSVFHNRLEIGMALESDATVNFFTGKNDPGVAYIDRDTPNIYNTYLNPGIPPTPITNPSLASIVGALNPSDTEYLYFYHTPNGDSFFNTNFQSHSVGVCRDLGC